MNVSAQLFRKYYPIFIFLLACLSVFSLELPLRGFPQKGHLAWVSSHTSAQVITATPQNWFVGRVVVTEKSGTTYYYDRYPLFFAAFTNLILSPFANEPELWILWSRYFMDIIFLLSILVVYRITGHFLQDRIKRISATALSFSGYYFMVYKAMLHFDQPAILGMMLLSEAIVDFEKNGNKGKLIFWSLISPLMGRGYVSLFLLVLYLFSRLLRKLEYQKLFCVTLLPGGLLALSFLLFNIFREMMETGKGLNEISIVVSAKARVGLGQTQVPWETFLMGEWKKLFRHLTPHIIPSPFEPFWIVLCGILIFWFSRKREFFQKSDENLLFLFLLSGPFWLLPMKRLAFFHDYTALYYWGAGPTFYLYIVKNIPYRKTLLAFSLLIAEASLERSYLENKSELSAINDEAEQITEFKARLKDKGRKLSFYEGYRRIFPGKPYAPGFYFYDVPITARPAADDFILSRYPIAGKVIFQSEHFRLTTNPDNSTQN